MIPAPPSRAPATPAALGLDAGGTATRWALANAQGQLLAEGQVGGLTALMMGQAAGQAELRATVRQIRGALDGAGAPQELAVVAGFSGYSEDPDQRLRIEALLGQALGTPAARVRVVSDITLAFLDAFTPGAGCLVYAGTGSVALCIEADGQVHRAGGRGSLLDDGGSGYWMAREALRRVWRAEDESPGVWRESVLAQRLFAQIGDSSWSGTRAFVYQGTRGQIGELAQAVAVAAQDGDLAALEILRGAGQELARLVLALRRRVGARPVGLAGRAASLHPLILRTVAEAVPPDAAPRQLALHSHATAARLAAQQDAILQRLPDA